MKIIYLYKNTFFYALLLSFILISGSSYANSTGDFAANKMGGGGGAKAGGGGGGEAKRGGESLGRGREGGVKQESHQDSNRAIDAKERQRGGGEEQGYNQGYEEDSSIEGEIPEYYPSDNYYYDNEGGDQDQQQNGDPFFFE